MPQPDLDLNASEAERAAQYERNEVTREGNAFTGIHYSTQAHQVPFDVSTNYDDFFSRYEETQRLYDRAIAANYAGLLFSVPTGVFLGVGLADKIVGVGHPPGFLEREGEIAIWSLAGASLLTLVITLVVGARALHRLPERYNNNLRRELRLVPAAHATRGPKRQLSIAPVGIQIRW